MELTVQELIDGWKKRVNENQKTNYALAIKHNRYHYWIGLPATIFATIAGAILLADVDEQRIRTAIGIVGIIAAIFCAILTFYSHAKRAEYHRFAASRFIHVRRDLEILERFVPENKSEREQRTREFDARILSIEEDAPAISVRTVIKKWPWILPIFVGAILLIVLLVIGIAWLERIPTARQSVVVGIKESVQQGIETWEFDSRDPLLKERIILVNTLINEITTQKVITSLNYLNEKDNEAPITIYLSSTGGYTKDAYAILHAIQESEAIVNTVALGDCFSACTKILMSGTGVRKIAQDSRMMIHTHAYPYDGDPYSNNTILYEREREFFRKNSAIPLDWIGREEKFYYLTPEQAITYQLVDEILNESSTTP
ncbi:MAG: SLATT domain-containing protein [Anaerolineales bacterium]|nr:SLATT domain-containing protein [Anaerolineales bacterium]